MNPLSKLRPLLALTLLLAAASSTTGCIVVTDDFDPFGFDSTVSASWTVDGLTPGVVSCGEITSVRLLLCDDASGTDCQTRPDLTVSCASGVIAPSGTVLAAGFVYFRYEALDSNGDTVDITNPVGINVIGPSTAIPTGDLLLPTPAFNPFGSDISVDGDWLVNGDTPTAFSCDDIDTVRWVICEDAAATTCVTSPTFSFPCEQGSFDTTPTAVLAHGDYYSLWEALDASGNVVQESNVLRLDLTSSSLVHTTAATPDFEGALPPTEVTVEVRFQQDTGSTTYDTCAAVDIGAGEFEYRMVDGVNSGDPEIVSSTVQSCAVGSDILFTENASFQFDTGPYTLFVHTMETVNASCTANWGAKCTFNPTLNVSNIVECDATVSYVGGGCV